MKISKRRIRDITIVDISGGLVLGEESAILRGLVGDLMNKGHQKILFNLGDVQYIDSSGLGFLVSTFTSLGKQGGRMKLLKLTDRVQDVMQITKLYTIFDIFDDETAAIESFGQAVSA